MNIFFIELNRLLFILTIDYLSIFLQARQIMDDKDKLEEWYIRNRQVYLNNHKEQQALLDRNLLYFSSAVLGFSLTIRERLQDHLILNIILLFVWLSLTISITLIFYSFRYSIYASKDFITQFDKNYQQENLSKPLKSKYNDHIEKFNTIAFYTNITGLALLVLAYGISQLK